MIKMQHWIVTRFNLGLYRVKRTLPDWFDKRIEIFGNYTVPSIQSQTIRNFRWLILIDADTPKKHGNKIADIITKSNLPVDIFPLKLQDGWQAKTYGERTSCEIEYKEVRNFIRDQSTAAIQTRLDNDDMLMPRAIQTIQENSPSVKSRYSIDFINGYLWDKQKNKMYSINHKEGTPFISLYQKCDKTFRFIYDSIHSKMYKNTPIVIKPDPIWCMVIHDHNCSNTLFDWMNPNEIQQDYILRKIGIIK